MCKRKLADYIAAIDRNTAGLTAVSTGVCPGCEKCRDEYGKKVACECIDEEGRLYEDEMDCPKCDGKGMRPPTMDEFDEQWSSGGAYSEGGFSWHSCGICGSRLGGNREPWHGVDANNEIMHFDDACTDCVCWLANGDVPSDCEE
jgi:hypothetical protein